MATAAHAVFAANTFTCTFPTQRRSFFFSTRQYNNKANHFTLRASTEEADCNVEECAPEKEVGKVSVEWMANEKTKVSGTYPPRPRNSRGYTGYVEKDTAGQTNIYSVEPAVYVAESVLSSGSAGSSADGAENTAAIAAGIALISIAAASSILFQVSKNPPQMEKVEYSGPSLSYYINKFKPEEIVQTSAPSVSESEPSQIQTESELQPEPSADSVSNIS